MSTKKIPSNMLVQSCPGDTLQHVKSVLRIIEQPVQLDAYIDDIEFGKHLNIQMCADALDYEADRITDWRGRGEA